MHIDKSSVPLLAVLLALACGQGTAAAPQPVQATLKNGDFSAPLDSGWQRDFRNFDGGGSVQTPAGGGATVRKTMCGWNRLSQSVAVTNPEVTFRTRARFVAESNRPDYHAHSNIALTYLDTNARELGETRWQLLAGRRNVQNSATRRLVPIEKAATWLDLDLNVAEELRTKLPGINPADVRALRISLESFGSGTGGC